MLVLARKSGQKIHIGDNITITVIQTHSNKVKLGIEAPDDTRVMRGELMQWLSDELDQEETEAVPCCNACEVLDYARV